MSGEVERSPQSDGERLMAAWLRQQQWPWQYEPETYGQQLDFLAISPRGPIIVEVFEPKFRLPRPAGFYDSVAPVLRAFEGRKRRQIGAAKLANLPLLLVVGSADSDLLYGEEIQEAMVGRLGVTVPLDSTDASTFELEHLGGGRVQPKLFTTVSAVASIRRFNPTERGRGDQTASLARLIVFHNPYAERPLDPDLFGPYDEQRGLVTLDNRSVFGPIANGRLVKLVLAEGA